MPACRGHLQVKSPELRVPVTVWNWAASDFREFLLFRSCSYTGSGTFYGSARISSVPYT